MKKIILILICIFIFIFTIPIIFTKQISEVVSNTVEQIENKIIESNYDYKNYQTINLLHTKTSEIEKIKLDEYLYGVVSAEMPVSFEKEALKAQAVVARTYTIYKIVNNNNKHGEADICDDSTCCQAWISKEDRLAK